MYKLLVNSPDGEQRIEDIGATGSYFDQSLVVWDERRDGPLPNSIALGKMQRSGNQLIMLDSFLPDHLGAILSTARTQKIAELKNGYVAEVYSPIVHAGHTWGSDEDSRTLLAQVLAVGSVPSDMYWRDSSGTPRAMNYANLQGLGAAILARGLAADNNLMMKTVALNDATTAAEIDAITW